MGLLKSGNSKIGSDLLSPNPAGRLGQISDFGLELGGGPWICRGAALWVLQTEGEGREAKCLCSLGKCEHLPEGEGGEKRDGA